MIINAASKIRGRRAVGAGVVLMAIAACSRQADGVEPAAADSSPQASALATGEWTLVAPESRLSFVSIKNNAIAEVHVFSQLSGGVDAQGKAELRIPLTSVTTGIEIRDQRLRDLLFEVAKFPEAVITMAVDPSQVRALGLGKHVIVKAGANLQLHGFSNPLPVALRVTRTQQAQWLVTSERPVIVDAVNFGLIQGVDELRKVAGLQAIAGGVPVTFTLIFTTAP